MALSDDVDVLARTIYGEARNQGWDGMAMVGHVVMNRVRSEVKWWGTTVRSVCLKPRQFSCWNASDPNRQIIQRVNLSNRVFMRAYSIACRLVSGEPTPDPTLGATHYFTVDKPPYAQTWPPAWSKGMTKTLTWGDHVFYRE